MSASSVPLALPLSQAWAWGLPLAAGFGWVRALALALGMAFVRGLAMASAMAWLVCLLASAGPLPVALVPACLADGWFPQVLVAVRPALCYFSWRRWIERFWFAGPALLGLGLGWFALGLGLWTRLWVLAGVFPGNRRYSLR